MSKLTRLLQLAYAGNSERKRLLNNPHVIHDLGGKDSKTYKTLLQSDSISETTLLQEEVHKTVVEGAEPYKCFRDVLPVIKTDSYSVRVVTSQGNAYAEDIAEGAEIPIDTTSYAKTDITIKKIGTRPLITNELIEDALFDVVELELKKAGARLENKLNRDCLQAILKDLDGITDVDPAGTALSVTDLATARALVESEGRLPDTLITHPIAEGQLLKDSNLVYVAYAGQGRTLETGELPRILGLRPYTLSVTTESGFTYSWDGTDADNHYYALVLDSKNAAFIAMRRDITIEQYDDPIHDLLGISCTMRYGVAVVDDKAGVRILAK
ncbi:MAG: phage major capsid protein [Planctomycetota bacterium]|nr:MAG: phage major capsid protein [Planctomycetota bacterium]